MSEVLHVIVSSSNPHATNIDDGNGAGALIPEYVGRLKVSMLHVGIPLVYGSGGSPNPFDDPPAIVALA